MEFSGYVSRSIHNLDDQQGHPSCSRSSRRGFLCGERCQSHVAPFYTDFKDELATQVSLCSEDPRLQGILGVYLARYRSVLFLAPSRHRSTMIRYSLELVHQLASLPGRLSGTLRSLVEV
jgi:hypothetical protein